ncbi:MAG: hypothetical protein M5U22_21790 [Thermoleophilia bacterium]|nr:hypothetical protein [Thermoleophilia bacterium]
MAAAPVLAAAVMVALMVMTPNSFHPDNPVLDSGSVRYVGTFLGVVLGLLLACTGALLAGGRRP